MSTFITLTEAKEHLSIDPGLTVHDKRINRLIGASIDWAENYTQRSLGELLQLDSPRDSLAVPEADPVESPNVDPDFLATAALWGSGYDWSLSTDQWQPGQFKCYWANYLAKNPVLEDHSHPERRDVQQACLMMVELMFDRNVANFEDLTNAAQNLLWPYRIGMGV